MTTPFFFVSENVAKSVTEHKLAIPSRHVNIEAVETKSGRQSKASHTKETAEASDGVPRPPKYTVT
jgi:hypothetical protein